MKKKKTTGHLSDHSAVTSRRKFLSGSAALALGGALTGPWLKVAQAGVPGEAIEALPETADAITVETLAEAEKLHLLSYTPEERDQLLKTIDGNMDFIKEVRAVPRPLELQPAITFDPRLPGVAYSAQENRLHLAPKEPEALPDREVDIAFASVKSQAHWIRAKQITSRRLTEIYLSRIRRIAPKLFCYITVTEELALREADQSDRELAAGRYRGYLHGIPYGIKDVFDTAGILTTWGATPYKNRVPIKDAAIVGKLREAGAVLLGKQATATLANGTSWFGGTCRNPWNPDEHAGGSSAGPGSATAAALCSFSIGTDSLGSILNPADRCGVVGLRATFGRIPTAGAMPLTPSLDRIGPLTRAVEDAAIVMSVINGPDPGSATSIDLGFEYNGQTDVRNLTVGYSEKWFERIGFQHSASVPASQAHIRALEALKELGVNLVKVELPTFPYQALRHNLFVEAAAIFEELTLEHDDDLLDNSWPTLWRQARFLSAVDYLQAERMRRQIMIEMHKIFSEVDALFAPTYGSMDLLVLTNFTGHPGISLRAGLTESPTRKHSFVPEDPNGKKYTITQNVAIHGRLFEEGKILALAHALEKKLQVDHHRPAIG